VIVSGLLSPASAPAEVLRIWDAGGFEAISCAAHVSEVAEVLLRPPLATRVSADRRARLIAYMVNRTRFVPDAPAERLVPDDPDDDYLVRMARDWNAALVTGDRHLLDLGSPAIMRPAAFVDLLTG
jgi:predicted nucleic acid-binding protein